MSWNRVFATYAGEGDESTSNKEEKIVLQVKIGNDNKLELMSQYFGYTREFYEESGQYEQYPFFCYVENNELFIDFGAGLDDERYAKSNLPIKEIIPNEFFTYFNGLDEDAEKWTYRIETVTPI